MNTFEPCLVYPLNSDEPHWAIFHLDQDTQQFQVTLKPVHTTQNQDIKLVLSEELQHLVIYSHDYDRPRTTDSEWISFELSSPCYCLVFNQSSLLSYPLQHIPSEQGTVLSCNKGKQYDIQHHQWKDIQEKNNRPHPDTKKPIDLRYKNISITLDSYQKIKGLPNKLDLSVLTPPTQLTRIENTQKSTETPTIRSHQSAPLIQHTAHMEPLPSETIEPANTSSAEGRQKINTQQTLEMPGIEMQEIATQQGQDNSFFDDLNNNGHIKPMSVDETWIDECAIPLKKPTGFEPFNETILSLKSICRSKDTYIAALIAILTNGKVILLESEEQSITEMIRCIRWDYFRLKQAPTTQKLYVGLDYSDFFDFQDVRSMGELYTAFCETLLLELLVYRDTVEHVATFFNHLEDISVLKNPPRELDTGCHLIFRQFDDLSLPSHVHAAYIVRLPAIFNSFDLMGDTLNYQLHYVNRHKNECQLLSTSYLDIMELCSTIRQNNNTNETTQSLMKTDLDWIKENFNHTHQDEPILQPKLAHLIKTYQNQNDDNHCDAPPNTPEEPLNPEEAAALDRRQDLSSLIEKLNEESFEQSFEQKLSKTKERMRDLGELGKTVLKQIERLEYGTHSHWLFWFYWQGSMQKLTAIVDEIIKLDLRTENELREALASDPSHPPNSGLYDALNRHRLWSFGRTMTRSVEAIHQVLTNEANASL